MYRYTLNKLLSKIGEKEIGNLQCLIATYSQEYVDLKLGMEYLVHDDFERFEALVSLELLERVVKDLVHLHNKNIVNHKYDLIVEELLEIDCEDN